MKYWEEMQSKYGFSDGEAVPYGVELYREAYVAVVNAYAARFGSKCRAVPFDRFGVHNPILIILVPVESASSPPETWVNTMDADEAMEAAIEKAMDADVDQFVYVDFESDEDDFIQVNIRLDRASLIEQYGPNAKLEEEEEEE